MRMGSNEVKTAKVATLRDCCDSLELDLANELNLEWLKLTAAIVEVRTVR